LLKKGDPKSTYWSKASIVDDLQVVSEYISYRLYRLFGIGVAKEASLVIGDDGKLRMVMSSVSGQHMQFSQNWQSQLIGTDFRKGLFVDAFLGHWDVIGTAPRSNLFIDKDKVSRIDTGGLDFRAMGARKGKLFGDKVSELGTYAGIGGATMPSTAATAYGGIKNNSSELAEAASVFKSVSWSQIESEVKSIEQEIQGLAAEHGMEKLSQQSSSYINHVLPILKSRYQHTLEQIAGL
jgi:hypothetical protein